jgi:hypothetical protein
VTGGWGGPDDGPSQLDVRNGQLAAAMRDLTSAWQSGAGDRDAMVRAALASAWDLAYATGRIGERESYASPTAVAILSVRCPNVDKNPRYPCAGVVGQPCTDAIYGTPTVHVTRAVLWESTGGVLPA